MIYRHWASNLAEVSSALIKEGHESRHYNYVPTYTGYPLGHASVHRHHAGRSVASSATTGLSAKTGKGTYVTEDQTV
jgi:hypothetical protein